MGQTASLLERTAEGVERYDRDRHHKLSYVFAGHDPGVCAFCVRSTALGLAGRAGSVRPTLEAGLALANSLQHPLTLAFAQGIACFSAHIVGDSGGCRDYAQQLVQVSERYEFPVTRAVGSFMLGAALAQQGDVAAALRHMEPSFEATLAYGFFGVLPGVILAEALAGAGRGQEALVLIARLLDESTTPEVGIFISELWRIRGELVLRQSASNVARAESYLATALRIATGQGAPVYQLRAAIALARLLAEAGRRDEARTAISRGSVDNLTDWNGPELAVAARLQSALG
jgi:ATP/maltotriose-dependent transcriptional regulator MalT